MPHKILIIIFFLSLSTFGQEVKRAEYIAAEKTIKQDFTKAKLKKYYNLVPYYRAGKWGYIDKVSKKIIITAKYDHLGFFHPDMYGNYKGFDFDVDSTAQVNIWSDIYDEPPPTTIREIGEMDMDDIHVNREREYSDDIRVSADTGFKGFSVNKQGEVLLYSYLYNRFPDQDANYNIRPFKMKGKYYALAKDLKGNAGIIGTAGHTLQGFEFQHANIIINRYAKDTNNTWFFVLGKEGYWSLQNNGGEVKSLGEITSYPLNSILFGYGVLSRVDRSAFYNLSKYGIMDYSTLEWAILPNRNQKPELYYSSKGMADTENHLMRENANIYYLVEDGNAKYYMDLKGTKYLPVN